jgi:hypothetical protein
MPLFTRREEAQPAPDGDELARHAVLRSGSLLAPWFIQYRLDEETDRARRYGRPLAVMVATPALLPGEPLSRAARQAASDAALHAARTTDLVGWADDEGRILIIMPETTADLANVAASRWRDEMWLRGRNVNGPKWEITLVHHPDEFTNREVVSEAVRLRVETEQQRPGGRVRVEDVA